MRRCFFSLDLIENFLSQQLQTKLSLYICVLMCFFMFIARGKPKPHTGPTRNHNITKQKLENIYIVACQGSGVSIKSCCPNADKRTPQDPLACFINQQLTRYTNPHTTTRLALTVGRNNILSHAREVGSSAKPTICRSRLDKPTPYSPSRRWLIQPCENSSFKVDYV